MKKIMVVEDDWKLNQSICYALEKEGYIPNGVHSIAEAADVFKKEDISLVILDVNLPDGEGFSFCKWAKTQRELPVLFLTARDLEEDALRGYELGADDYVTKPFSMKILLKKIEVFLKRTKDTAEQGFCDGFLNINFDRAKVYAGEEECSLTPTEYRLLRELVTHAGQLLTYDVLLERLWDSGGQFVDKHALAVNINRLRGKIEDEEHKYISNVYGMGYQWLDS